VEWAVASVLTQDYAGDLEVILAEGGSSDDSRAVIERIAAAEAQVRVVDNPAGITPAGLNAAIFSSRGEVIVRCDAHSQLPASYISAAVARLESTGAGVVGGIQDAQGEAPFERAVAYAMANPIGSGGAAYRTSGAAGIVETVYLGVFRRAALIDAGLYDETLLRNQDYELNHRISAAGYDVFFAPELNVRYKPRSTLRSLWRQYFDYGRFKRLVLRRLPGSLRMRQLAAPALIVGLVVAAVLTLTPLRLPAILVPLVYLVVVLAGTVSELVRRRDGAAWLVAFVLPTMHLAWGLGFWRAGTGNPDPRIPRLDS
jgi:glycosyltransferase involved in cell wall biosynthesis